jgi:short-subunit dehydrogenase
MPPEQRVVLLTGGSAGIGYEAALAFARRGDRVGATARRLDRLEKLAAAARDLPGTIRPYAVDVCDAAGMRRVVEDMVAHWNRLDVLVANAGVGQRGGIVNSAWDDLEIVLRTNIDGVLHSVRAAVPAMRRSGGGNIIMISSVAAQVITPYATVYAASKAALNAIARGLRAELKPDNIWVTNILLGRVQSEFAQARRGIPGRPGSRLPTMKTDYVARCIVRESLRRRRSVSLRVWDRLTNMAGLYFPWFTDRLLARIYRPQ